MKSNEIRDKFISFFESKGHKTVDSAPMVIKDDPTLMFTNAGMNQFKDIFLENKKADFKRVVNSQKCLRVSGKHNDLEEVGMDTYHHTMFEMLGNWSFGDYFKKDAINYAWELLVEEYGIDKDRLYATVFEGDKSDNLGLDEEAKSLWLQYLPENRILNGNKKDNFWEMGDQGPCGPCSEIHIDIRSDEERKKVDGAELVNKDHPQVIEIWNLVFIEFNRKANGSLEKLPKKHIDTGMGFERLCMVLQGKQSNYDTDVFQPLIQEIAAKAKVKYGNDEKIDIALRVVADHIRAVSFAIADGQLPSNNKAGYVIRRILRRATRYAYTYLGFEKAFMFDHIKTLSKQMGDYFPELKKNLNHIEKVVKQEEESFLSTLSKGISLLDDIMKKLKTKDYKSVKGSEAFELYDTFGFPFDLTELILRENGFNVSKREFDEEMEKQRQRSKKDADKSTSDWTVLLEDEVEEFIGYTKLKVDIKITKYRKVKTKKGEQIQLVFNHTPFYPEGGGQVGDTGYIDNGSEKISVLNTVKENNQIIHFAKKLPENLNDEFTAYVNENKRRLTANNHTATHLLHKALRNVLGKHVEQKGSLVNDEYLRFDFSHFEKLSDDDILQIENLVNEDIRRNISAQVHSDVSMKEAKEIGALALFGEKYGDVVRVVEFGDSVELCGGTHVEATGNIGLFKIISESSIAAGIRRVEAVTSQKAVDFVNDKINTLENIQALLKNQKDLVKAVKQTLSQNKELQKKLDAQNDKIVNAEMEKAIAEAENMGDFKLLRAKFDMDSDALKNMAFGIAKKHNDIIAVLATQQGKKAILMVSIPKNLVESKNLNAGNIIRELSKEIKGGGGGQAHFATAGGGNVDGIQNALDKVSEIL